MTLTVLRGCDVDENPPAFAGIGNENKLDILSNVQSSFYPHRLHVSPSIAYQSVHTNEQTNRKTPHEACCRHDVTAI